MRTDPRTACANEREMFWWAMLHDLIAHPFMALTIYSTLSLRFHDWTSNHAWPRNPYSDENIVDRLGGAVLEADVWSPMKNKYVRVSVHPTTMDGFWSIDYGHRHHSLTVKEDTSFAAMKRGIDWLYELEDEDDECDHEPRFMYVGGRV